MQETTQMPVIKAALGDSWEALGDVVKRHYHMAPGEPAEIVIEGVMDEVYHSMAAKLFLLPGRIFGALVPYRGKMVPTRVKNWTTAENNKAMFWHRSLRFPDKRTVIFRSRMEHAGDDEIIEYVKYGMGIRMRMSVEEGVLVFRSIDYVWKIAGFSFHIPCWAILGSAAIREWAVSEQEFEIEFTMDHPLLGRTFSYGGSFKIVEKKYSMPSC